MAPTTTLCIPIWVWQVHLMPVPFLLRHYNLEHCRIQESSSMLSTLGERSLVSILTRFQVCFSTSSQSSFTIFFIRMRRTTPESRRHPILILHHFTAAVRRNKTEFGPTKMVY